ncbi:uncharacterized protein LOC106706696 [Latimeria chalumnae]|uniref:uncharacterized protein LOC106706696 n=1 Tax=Latimeria chalumnae TaxID=7897 RepID=UPI00313DECE2
MSADCNIITYNKCGKQGHSSVYCTEAIVCNLCKKSGHAYTNCPESVYNCLPVELLTKCTVEEEMDLDAELRLDPDANNADRTAQQGDMLEAPQSEELAGHKKGDLAKECAISGKDSEGFVLPLSVKQKEKTSLGVAMDKIQDGSLAMSPVTGQQPASEEDYSSDFSQASLDDLGKQDETAEPKAGMEIKKERKKKYSKGRLETTDWGSVVEEEEEGRCRPCRQRKGNVKEDAEGFKEIRGKSKWLSRSKSKLGLKGAEPLTLDPVITLENKFGPLNTASEVESAPEAPQTSRGATPGGDQEDIEVLTANKVKECK